MSNTKSEEVRFTLKQIQWLDKMFPELVLPTTASNEVLRDYFGQRKVISVIRERADRRPT